MTLQFRHFKQILEDWLSYVTGHSDITDINPGSVVRTIGEATSIEAAAYYVQLQSVLSLFSIDKASGEDLDERAQDFGLTRNQPTTSAGDTTIGDSDLTSADYALSDSKTILTAAVSVQVQIDTGDYADFPATGSIIINRAGASRELVAYTSKTGPDLLNLGAAVANSHSIGETVHLSTVGTDRVITTGQVVKTETIPIIRYETTEDGTLYDGEISVANIAIVSQETGADTIASSGTLTAFDGPPFATATVTNPSDTAGGEDLESDPAFRSRIKNELQNRSSSTPRIIEQAALGVEITSPVQRVITAKVIEPIDPGASTLYISDGTSSYTPSQVSVVASEFAIPVGEPGQYRGTLNNWPLVTGTERIFVSAKAGQGVGNDSVGFATGVAVDEITDTGQAWGANVWLKGPDPYYVKDENNVVYEITGNDGDTLFLTGGATPTLGAYAIFDSAALVFGSGGSLLEKDVDYIINDTNGDFELTVASFPTGLDQYDVVLAYYNGVLAAYVYYDGLLQEVQKVINGDPDDLDTYPGVKASGTRVDVTTPTVTTVTINATISAVDGVDETTLLSSVETEVLNYVNNLTIGEDVLVSALIEAVRSVDGVYDVSIITPASNIVITDSQLAKTTSSDITVT